MATIIPKARKPSHDEKQVLYHGFWNIGPVVDPPVLLDALVGIRTRSEPNRQR